MIIKEVSYRGPWGGGLGFSSKKSGFFLNNDYSEAKSQILGEYLESCTSLTNSPPPPPEPYETLIIMGNYGKV